MRISKYTDKHFNLMCKNMNENFFVFKTDDDCYNICIDFVSMNGEVVALTDFLPDVDRGHLKKILISLFHDKVFIPHDGYTNNRVCCMPLTDYKSVRRNNRNYVIVADNNGFYGF